MPFGYSRYLEKQGYKEVTVQEHAKQLELFFKHVDYIHETVPELYEIKPSDLKSYIQFKKSQQLKPGTINKIISILKRFFDYCWEERLIAADPAEKLRYIQDSKQPISADGFDEIQQIIDDAVQDEEMSLKRKCILVLAGEGLRPDEFAVTVDQIITEEQLVRLYVSKSGHERIITMDGLRAQVIKQQLRDQLSKERQYLISSVNRSTGEEPLQRMTISVHLRKAAEAAGLDSLTTNQIRRAYAVHLLDNQGWSYEEAAEKLGIDKLSVMKLVDSVS
ncbi:tyrosine-type recombinase/integrase [Alkalicoccus chagannorensis]|uniref:tyrosine-type recombinase/integrase n=1 Tax=Alkalicoccus chagannorensis TaxID=427072 RepID=UPI0004027769|nr:tyrosine-type recombinase/integrase [Alkalicoccus chagannorensis]